MTTAVESGAQGVRWDITLLAPTEEAIKERLEAAVADAESFVERWPAESLAEIEPAQLATLLGELAELKASRKEGDDWAMMLVWTDSENPAVLDVQAWVNDRLPRLDDAIRHFELAWLAVPDDRAQALASDEAVARDRHYLLSLRRFAPFMLSAPEERVLSARDASAATAWKSLRDRTLGALVTSFDDGTGEREWTLAELESARRSHPDREVRRSALVATKELLEPVLPVLAHSYDSIVADRLAVDRLRGHADPMEETNLVNEIDAAVVEGLLAASEAHSSIGHRWLRDEGRAARPRATRLDRLPGRRARRADPSVGGRKTAGRGHVRRADARARRRGGEVLQRSPHRRRAEARQAERRLLPLAEHTRAGFRLPELARPAGRHARARPRARPRLHFALAAARQSDNSYSAGLTVSEVPSTFAELRLVDHLLATDEELGRALLTRELDQAVGVGFMAAPSPASSSARTRSGGGQALNPERLERAGELDDGERLGRRDDRRARAAKIFWASMPHFVHERFYTYAYTFAFLLAAGLVARSREDGFGERYERFLAAGGSASPEELMAILEIDLRDPEIWNDGFSVMEGWIDRIG